MHRPLLLGAFLLSVVSGTPSARDRLHADSSRSGSATFYHSRSGIGTCTLPASSPWDSFYVSVNRKDFAKSLACGACMVVRHDTDSVLVRISDRCPGCKPGDLDLSRAAFRKLALLGTGRIAVSWHYVACPESSLVVRRTRGSSSFWSSLQAWGLPWPVETLSVANENGWIRFHRERHNQFTARKLPPTPWTLRTVDVRGAIRIDSSLALEAGASLSLDPSDSLLPE